MTKEYNEFLAHHGIKGQKWGVRRYQNEDGSLTPLGKKNLKADNYEQYGRRANAIRDLDRIISSKDPNVQKAYTDKDRKDLINFRNKMATEATSQKKVSPFIQGVARVALTAAAIYVGTKGPKMLKSAKFMTKMGAKKISDFAKNQRTLWFVRTGM